jgi:hypothetical protein
LPVTFMAQAGRPSMSSRPNRTGPIKSIPVVAFPTRRPTDRRQRRHATGHQVAWTRGRPALERSRLDGDGRSPSRPGPPTIHRPIRSLCCAQCWPIVRLCRSPERRDCRSTR